MKTNVISGSGGVSIINPSQAQQNRFRVSRGFSVIHSLENPQKELSKQILFFLMYAKNTPQNYLLLYCLT